MALKRHVIARLPTKLAATPRCALTVIALLMVGCGSMAPRYQPSSAPIPNDYPADAPRTSGQAGGTLEWRSVVADAELQRIIERALGNSRDTIRSREESFRIFNRRFEVGASTQLELMQVETLLTQAQSLAVQLEQARATNRHAVDLLVGEPIDLPLRADTFESDAEPVRAVSAGLPSDLLVQRPDVIAAEHQLRAAQANIGAARAAFFPPIFTGGRLRSNLDLAEVRRDLAVANYELTIQTAFRDVADALSVHHWLGEQLRIQRNALRALTERSRLAQLRYDSGAASYLEVLDAQRDLLSAEQALVQLQSALLSSRVALFAARGGGALGAGE